MTKISMSIRVSVCTWKPVPRCLRGSVSRLSKWFCNFCNPSTHFSSMAPRRCWQIVDQAWTSILELLGCKDSIKILDDAKQRAPCDLSIPKSYSFVGKWYCPVHFGDVSCNVASPCVQHGWTTFPCQIDPNRWCDVGPVWDSAAECWPPEQRATIARGNISLLAAEDVEFCTIQKI